MRFIFQLVRAAGAGSCVTEGSDARITCFSDIELVFAFSQYVTSRNFDDVINDTQPRSLSDSGEVDQLSLIS